MENLPRELLLQIINDLNNVSTYGVRNLSLTNRQLRSLCVGVVFNTITATSTSKSLKRLRDLANSSVASHVKSLRYIGKQLIDPAIENDEHFETSYTRRMYNRDREHGFWEPDNNIEYDEIRSELQRVAADQRCTQESGLDDRALTTAFKCFTNLTTFLIDFDRNSGVKFRDQSRRVLRRRVAYFREGAMLTPHLRTALRALLSSNSSITAFHIESDVAGVPSTADADITLMTNALARITSLSLLVCWSWYAPILPLLTLPCLQSLEFLHNGVQINLVEDFVRRHQKTLRCLRMKHVWFTSHPTGTDKSSDDGFTASRLRGMERIGQLGVLREVRVRYVVRSTPTPQRYLHDPSPLEDLLKGQRRAVDFTPQLLEYMIWGTGGIPEYDRKAGSALFL